MSTWMYAFTTAGLLALACPFGAMAQTASPQPARQVAGSAMTPARYLACQIELQRETIAGLQQVATLSRRSATHREMNQAAESSRNKVDAVGASCGGSPTALAAYAQREQGRIIQWLAEHPETQQRLNDLTAQLQALSDASAPPTLQEGQQ